MAGLGQASQGTSPVCRRCSVPRAIPRKQSGAGIAAIALRCRGSARAACLGREHRAISRLRAAQQRPSHVLQDSAGTWPLETARVLPSEEFVTAHTYKPGCQHPTPTRSQFLRRKGSARPRFPGLTGADGLKALLLH